MKIVSWNVNSLKARWNLFAEFVAEESPDVLLLQETKTQDENFPVLELQTLNYQSFFCGQKTFNGVAILVKNELQCALQSKQLFPELSEEQARFIEIELKIDGRETSIISIYVPNGEDVGLEKFEYKLKFLDALYKRLQQILKSEREIIIGGDFNIAPHEIDLWNPNQMHNECSFTMIERQKIAKIMNLNLFDVFRVMNPQKQFYSWWNYRFGKFPKNQGMRIDYFLTSALIAQQTKKCNIEQKWRAREKTSDHAPVMIEL